MLAIGSYAQKAQFLVFLQLSCCLPHSFPSSSVPNGHWQLPDDVTENAHWHVYVFRGTLVTQAGTRSQRVAMAPSIQGAAGSVIQLVPS